MLHFPESDGATGKLKKFQYILKHFSICLKGKLALIDENLIDFEGRAPAIQYMPNKHHHRFGFKFFCLVSNFFANVKAIQATQ